MSPGSGQLGGLTVHLSNMSLATAWCRIVDTIKLNEVHVHQTKFSPGIFLISCRNGVVNLPSCLKVFRIALGH